MVQSAPVGFAARVDAPQADSLITSEKWRFRETSVLEA
jgi:hypothetical protein